MCPGDPNYGNNFLYTYYDPNLRISSNIRFRFSASDRRGCGDGTRVGGRHFSYNLIVKRGGPNGPIIEQQNRTMVSQPNNSNTDTIFSGAIYDNERFTVEHGPYAMEVTGALAVSPSVIFKPQLASQKQESCFCFFMRVQ